MDPRAIKISEFNYALPEDRIAKYPLPLRDDSKLLVFKNEQIQDAHFHQLGQYLNDDFILIGNNTRVIPARLFFRKESGALIEIFCLEPAAKSHQDAMLDSGSSSWICMVGGAKKWKGEEVLIAQLPVNLKNLDVTAKKSARKEDQFVIEFSWNNSQIRFSEILDAAGELPLPPYFNRKAEEDDYLRYQTVFASMQGSVAAPTAGLHFTESLFESLHQKGIIKLELTLHVGAGTFKPVSSESMEGHTMHGERFSVSTAFLQYLIAHPDKKIITIGTTTTRALESLYWLGLKWMQQPDAGPYIQQWDPYETSSSADAQEVLQFLYDRAMQLGLKEIEAETMIMIAPGYSFKFVHGLITNFHMPKSTLLLLVAAITGKNSTTGLENWKEIYHHALENAYRFLSYGDSSLLFNHTPGQSR